MVQKMINVIRVLIIHRLALVTIIMEISVRRTAQRVFIQIISKKFANLAKQFVAHVLLGTSVLLVLMVRIS
jgi:hypothetical protein